LTSPQYLGLRPDSSSARTVVETLKQRCRLFGGEFVILWHNHVVADALEFDAYRDAVVR
jgi:hypothetical protein